MSTLTALGFGLYLTFAGSSSLVATDVIRAGDRLSDANTTTESGELSAEDQALMGKEVRRTVYVGQAIKPENTQTPRLVTRNQTVTVKYIRNALEISMSGRAMSDAGQGEQVSVMNLQSRQLITGVVTKDGWILAQ